MELRFAEIKPTSKAASRNAGSSMTRRPLPREHFLFLDAPEFERPAPVVVHTADVDEDLDD